MLISEDEAKSGAKWDTVFTWAWTAAKVVFYIAVAAFVVFFCWSMVVQYKDCTAAGKVLVHGAWGGYECVSP